MNESSPIGRFWWLRLPVLLMLVQFGIELLVPKELLPDLHSESGPHEMVQSVFISGAFLVGVATLFKLDWSRHKPVGMWILLATVCSFYVAGEEISWGQHILNWNTPEYWSAVNDQNETNFHNTSAWLDQKPRLILFAGIIVGGLLIPALRRWKPSALPARFEILYPPSVLAVTALFVTIPYTVEKILSAAGIHTFTRVSEVQELYMYYFILLYLIDLRKRVISQV